MKQSIEKIERRIWQLMLMAIIVILLLTLTLLAIQFVGFIGESKKILSFEGPYKYSIFLFILVLLFCAYMIINQRKFLQISKAFFKEKEAADILSRNVKTLSSLLEVSSSINSKQKLSDILTTISREILTCFDADQSSVMLIDQASGLLKTQAASGKGAEYATDAMVPMGESVAGWVLKNDKALLLNGQVNPSDFPGTPIKGRVINSALCIPLKIGKKGIGVLNVNVVGRDNRFSETDLKLLTIFGNSASVAIHNAMLLGERTRRIQLQSLFEQYHSPQVVQKLIKQTGSLDPRPKIREKMELTVLFADIREFTSLLSTINVEDLVDFLDLFYSAMTKAVFDNDGTLDKFIGDEVMAFFGAPLSLENPADNAFKTAKEMLVLFHELKEKIGKNSSSFEKIGIGIGINTGEVFIGTVGSEKRYEYTVIGDAVNLAHRLCSYAAPDQILTTDKTISKMNGAISSAFLKDISFKGITEAVHVYTVNLS